MSVTSSSECHREIERRWRITRLPEHVVPLPKHFIMQGYAECPPEELFVRECSGSDPFEIIIRVPRSERADSLEWSSFVPETIFQHLSEPENRGKVRIRQVDGKIWTLTVKGTGSIDRAEWESTVPERVARHLVLRAGTRLVFKNRTPVLFGERTLEFDDFHRRLFGLKIVECEFPNIDLANEFQLPPWIKGAVEVTEDKRFSNKNLATYGMPTSDKA